VKKTSAAEMVKISRTIALIRQTRAIDIIFFLVII